MAPELVSIISISPQGYSKKVYRPTNFLRSATSNSMWNATQKTFARYQGVAAPMVICLGTALVSVRPAPTLMETAKSRVGQRQVHSYGSPYLPQDIYYDPRVKKALSEMRTMKRDDIKEDAQGSKAHEGLKILDSSGRKDAGTLTLIGYKGGPLESQINQDRAMCVVPYHLGDVPMEKRLRTGRSERKDNAFQQRLIGVFDGHANLGEVVSEFVVSELPKLLVKKLEGLERTTEQISKALIETFVELDKRAPAEVSGGCTASVVLQDGPKVYFANAGDSRSFLVVYRAKSSTMEIAYITREDKPDLQDERERVESRGGQVYLPLRGTSRVLYTDPVTGMQSGLAMSRSIGDWEVGQFGVIPDPIVHVIDIPELVQSELKKQTGDDIHIFAVSATDGIMDFISPEAIGHAVALSLYGDEGPHLLTTLEQLIYIAAQRWEQSKQGRYRDDISVAVSQIRIPSDGLPKQ
jgi:serine/threonine protein phosphatase PrpC